jgi:L-asparagine oxygenase
MPEPPIPPDCTVALGATGREAVARLIAALPSFDVARLDARLLDRVAVAAGGLPGDLAERLVRFRRHGNPFGTLLVRGLPTDPVLPATPPDGRPAAAKRSRVSESCLLLSMALLGEPIGYADEKDGLLIHDVCPVRGREELQENSGSALFEFHTENAFHPYRPDFVGLLCLRPDRDGLATTFTASAERAAGMLTAREQALLRRPSYTVAMPTSFLGHREGRPRAGPLPVLSGSAAAPELCFDAHASEAIDPECAPALAALERALREVRVGTALEPGDLLIVDNRTSVHGRTRFRPCYDGADRWLQRMFAVRDLRRSLELRYGDSHVCRSFRPPAVRAG